ncbi:hypothetical protein SCAR479_05571 [Seiridium cardinale]|uniref:Ribosomal RNA-processing protein 14/surfeit locus protein 6 C-terminal domain-containing protein n=1 Tax=Seiridium cardinale TaxID=138064 RepID=A0ABR2XVN6_9PEZI
MAKDRAVKAEGKQKETKLSGDRVKKAQKEPKAKPVVEEDSEDSDSSAAESLNSFPAAEIGLTVSKKDGKKTDAKSDDSSSDSSSDSASEASDDSTSDSEEVEASAKAKKAPVEVEPNSIFTIDTQPTKVAAKASKAAPANAEEGTTEASAEGGKMNRRARRRLQLIGKQREALRKSMNLKADENSAELEAELDRWIQGTDGKAAARDKKKMVRKQKEAARLRTRKGKLLKGRKLKERKKVVDKQERREKKKAAQGLAES